MHRLLGSSKGDILNKGFIITLVFLFGLILVSNVHAADNLLRPEPTQSLPLAGTPLANLGIIILAAVEALIIGFLIITILHRRQAEKKLQENRAHLKDLVDLLPLIVFETDISGQIIFANNQAVKTLGYSIEEIYAGLNALQLLIPEDRQKASKNFQEALQGKESGNEYSALRKDGSTFPIIIYSSSIRHNSKVVGLRGAIIDISDSKMAEAGLRQSEAIFRSMIENAPVNINLPGFSGGKVQA
jgi:PAS domain S-box-containing protein